MRLLPLTIVSFALLTGCSATGQPTNTSQPVTVSAQDQQLSLKQRLALVALTPAMQDSGLNVPNILQNRLQLTAYRYPVAKVITDASKTAQAYQLQLPSGTSGYHMVYLDGDTVIFGNLEQATTLAKFAAAGTQTTVTALAKQTKADKLQSMVSLLTIDNQTAMHQETTSTDKDTAATFDGNADMANMTRQKAITWAWNHYHHEYLHDGTAYALANYQVECAKGTDGTWTIAFRKPVSGSNMTQLAAQYQITSSGKLLALIANED
ncbi:MAG: hypothetical protein LKJ69_01240 [Lactobacillus sp.]|jgi:hypothetical protein|nr:hypothetical protein [Lactobacillus sp.]MCI2032008.1 hypothetical protein [Lactobacillus sp.]